MTTDLPQPLRLSRLADGPVVVRRIEEDRVPTDDEVRRAFVSGLAAYATPEVRETLNRQWSVWLALHDEYVTEAALEKFRARYDSHPASGQVRRRTLLDIAQLLEQNGNPHGAHFARRLADDIRPEKETL